MQLTKTVLPLLIGNKESDRKCFPRGSSVQVPEIRLSWILASLVINNS